MTNRILLIGGGGYVGTELQKVLVEEGYRVRVFDAFWYPKGKWGLDSFPGSETIEYVTGDVRNYPLLEEALIGVDSCIHLACISNDPSYELNPSLAYSVNFEAFRDFIEILNRSSVKKIIYASSSSVYGVKSEPKVSEDLSLEPLTDYSRYKVECEKLLFSNLSSEITFSVLRPSTVCGHSKRQRFDLVVNILTLSALTENIIRVDGGNQFRPNLHIKDMLRSYALVLKSNPQTVNREIFNVAGENLTVNDIAIRVKKIVGSSLGSDVKIEYLPVKDSRSYRVSGEKIESKLGFTPKYSVNDAILEIVQKFTEGIYGDVKSTDYYNLQRMRELFHQVQA